MTAGLISKRAAEAVGEATRYVLTHSRNDMPLRLVPKPINGSRTLIAKAPAGGIAARDGSNILTSGTCKVYSINSSDTLQVYQVDGSDLELTVFNPFGTAITASAWILVQQEQASGKWIVTAEDC